MSDLTAFELLLRASDVRLPSAWQAAWEEAEATLRDTFPEGYDVLDVGRLAYDSLHDDLKPAALDALVYGWWEAQQDRNGPGLLAEIDRLNAELYTEQCQHRMTLEQRNAHAQELLRLRGESR